MSSLSSNNVIYGFQVAYENEPEKTVIDSNDLVKEYVIKEENAYKEKLRAEERERRLEEMRAAGEDIPEGMDVDEFLGLADTITGAAEEEEKEPDIDYVALAKEEAEKILDSAREQADEIISEATLNAEALKSVAREEGRAEGYNEGTQQAAMELKTAQDRMETEISSVKEEFETRSLTLEHDIVDMCLPVFKKVFGASLDDRKDILYFLLDHCLMKIERSKEMQIKVSETNADYVKEKKELLLERVGSDVNMDIIADPLLNDSQCIIETDGGIFDCSIDTELDQLLRDIKALS